MQIKMQKVAQVCGEELVTWENPTGLGSLGDPGRGPWKILGLCAC